ncbi:MAG: M24 family metallopeptidase [Acidobacteriota bacterium]
MGSPLPKPSLFVAAFVAVTVHAAALETPAPLPPLREQVPIRLGWQQARLERVLPALMRRHGVAMWLVVCREHNEDPVFFSLVSPMTESARRRTILLFHDRGPAAGVERIALGGGAQGGLFQALRDPEVKGRELLGATQWALLRSLIDERAPATIALDISHTHAFADGLSAGEREQLEAALGPWNARVVRAENLVIDYMATRVPEMVPHYRHLQRTAHALIARAFSSEAITPGVTTTEDVGWWLRDRIEEMGMEVWFHPDVSVQRRGGLGADAEREAVVIRPGDHLHTDVGILAMGLATDTQHVGYVLREGERDAPESLRRALKASNRLQDLLLERRPGRTGNAVLADTLAAMRAEGIDGSVYAHAIGDHGHGAGPIVGLYDHQEGVPGRGDLLVLPSTWYSIELQATSPVPEWEGQPLRSAQEEEALIDAGGRVAWAFKRQTRYHLVAPPAGAPR